ncbi:MAG: hypoxanthine phosphoribosyltransferase, partial [Peptococcaceae bacterium]|nr:hypoxanthine phosphoribosyltransferase [Peptococcaceae bacterium]
MEGSIKEILISREEIAERVKVLGEKISRDYFDKK